MDKGSSTTRQWLLRHETRYTYDRPVQRSTHRVHLRPVDDWQQTVRRYKLTIAPHVPVIDFEDVFGNWATRFEIAEPYTELRILAESEVERVVTDPFAFAKLPIRPAFPLVWMPWEQRMLAPYLEPAELPDAQLRELYHYAMAFVEGNNRDLMETLLALNLTLFREYQFTPGVTTFATTAYDVFLSRKGVCQDFSNLFICLARLLGIPARYVCGYVYNRKREQDRTRPDASHGWVQLYIQNIGWKGFDPTNGTLPDAEHIHVGYGRHYVDTAPTSGTLYTPAAERMEVAVEIAEMGRHETAAVTNPDAAVTEREEKDYATR